MGAPASVPIGITGSKEALGRLTSRELEVVEHVARGRSNAQIAEALVISEATVKTHVANILAKLAILDRVQIVVFAYEQGSSRRAIGPIDRIQNEGGLRDSPKRRCSAPPHRLAPTPDRLTASLACESLRAVGAVALDRRSSLEYLMAAFAFEQCFVKPFARADETGERDLDRGLASGTQ